MNSEEVDFAVTVGEFYRPFCEWLWWDGSTSHFRSHGPHTDASAAHGDISPGGAKHSDTGPGRADHTTSTRDAGTNRGDTCGSAGDLQ